MRKKRLPSILPIILLLTACAPDSSADVTAQASKTDATAQPETEIADFVPSAAQTPHSYQEIYAQTITENTNENALYSLIFLDGDGIPELVAYDSYDLTYSVYTVKDDALFCLADALGTVELTYFEQTGILCEFARWNGGGDEGGYGRSYYRVDHDRTLTDDDTPILNYVYNAVYDKENVYTGEGITEYFSMGEETDETSYEKLAENLGITEGDEKACSEHALEKEEMLTFLSET